MKEKYTSVKDFVSRNPKWIITTLLIPLAAFFADHYFNPSNPDLEDLSNQVKKLTEQLYDSTLSKSEKEEARTKLSEIESVLPEIEEELKKEPNNPDSWSLLGLSQGELQQPEKAEKSFSKAIFYYQKQGNKQEVAETQIDLGLVFEEQFKQGEACKSYQKALNHYKQIGIQAKVDEIQEFRKDANCNRMVLKH